MTGPDNASPEAVAAARDGILHPGTGPATVDGLRLRKIMGRYGWCAPARYGVDGWMMRRYDRTGSLLVSTSTYPDTPFLWTHASIAYNDHLPTYKDLVQLHRAVWGDTGWAYQVFTPTADHIDIHEHALHLFGRADGVRVLPDFAQFGSI
jgi:hypothetical protein